MLVFRDEELRPDDDDEPSAMRKVAEDSLPASELLALLVDPDASPRVLSDCLWNNGWSADGEGERKRLRGILLKHPDPLVRDRASLALEAWGDVTGLTDLVKDPDGGVQKSAMYHLGKLPPTPGIAELAWEHLHQHHVLSVHSTETLDTFVQHSDPAVSIRRLAWIAGDHGRSEALRVASVHHLADLNAAAELRSWSASCWSRRP